MKSIKTKDLLVEFVMTFQMVFFSIGAILFSQNNPDFGNLSVAYIVGTSYFIGVMLFTTISNGHMNPVVTLAAMVVKETKVKPGIAILITQLLASTSACYFLYMVLELPLSSVRVDIPHRGIFNAWIVEFSFSAITMFILFFTYKRSYITIGVVISLVLMIETYIALPISGASFNPARSIGAAIVSGNFEYLWIYITAPITGISLALFAALRLKKEN